VAVTVTLASTPITLTAPTILTTLSSPTSRVDGQIRPAQQQRQQLQQVVLQDVAGDADVVKVPATPRQGARVAEGAADAPHVPAAEQPAVSGEIAEQSPQGAEGGGFEGQQAQGHVLTR
jgi:hypothetical protein